MGRERKEMGREQRGRRKEGRGRPPNANSWIRPFLPERDFIRYVRVFAVAIPSVVCLSVVLTLVRPTQRAEPFGNRPIFTAVRWPSSDIQAKFYGDSPRRTPPSGALNTRGVSK